jgi:hypothetical protein
MRLRGIAVTLAVVTAGTVGYGVRSFLPQESPGAALRRACVSIIEEARLPLNRPQPVTSSDVQQQMVFLADRDAAMAPELTAALNAIPSDREVIPPLKAENNALDRRRQREDELDRRLERRVAVERAVENYRKLYPDSEIERAAKTLEEARREDSFQQAKEAMIRDCMLKRGLR